MVRGKIFQLLILGVVLALFVAVVVFKSFSRGERNRTTESDLTKGCMTGDNIAGRTRIGKTTKCVIDLAAEKDSVSVIVMLQGNEYTSSEFRDLVKKQAEVEKIQNKVIPSLNPKDVIITTTFNYIPSFAAIITQSGLEQLEANPSVISINLNGISRVQ